MKIKPITIGLISLAIIFATIVLYLSRVNLSGFFYSNTDFFKFYQSVRFYFAGQDIYSYTMVKVSNGTKWITANGNLNPPFLTTLLLPFYYVSYAIALKIWTCISIALFILSLFLSLSAFPQWRLKTWHYLAAIAGFLIYLPNSVTLAFGQITAYVLFPLVCAWLLARERRDILAGIFIGFACSIKVFCGLFFIYFLLLRRFRLLFSAAITYGLTFLIGLLMFGYHAYQRYDVMLDKIAWYAANWNASFLGFFMRLFSSAEGNKAIINLPYLVHPLTLLCSATLMIYLLITWNRLYRFSRYHNHDAFDMGYSFTLVAMLLLSPLGWIYYFPLLLISFLVIFHQSRYIKNGLLLQLFMCAVVLISTLSGDFTKIAMIQTSKEVLLNSGYGFYILMIFLFAMAYLTKQRIKQQFLQKVQTALVHENLWLVVFACTLIPSAYSLLLIAKHLQTFAAFI